MSDDGAGVAALAIAFTMMLDRAMAGHEEVIKIKDMLDRTLLGLERHQILHPTPEAVAAARSHLESLLQTLATMYPAPDVPGD